VSDGIWDDRLSDLCVYGSYLWLGDAISLEVWRHGVLLAEGRVNGKHLDRFREIMCGGGGVSLRPGSMDEIIMPLFNAHFWLPNGMIFNMMGMLIQSIDSMEELRRTTTVVDWLKGQYIKQGPAVSESLTWNHWRESSWHRSDGGYLPAY